jgi:thiamine biosynthesis lipoprotein
LVRGASALCSAGETTFLLQGGQSSVLGITEPDASPWQIDLRYPLGDLPRIASIYLTDQAMATSGGLVQRVSCGHRTFGHIIDPRTGWPTDGLVTATAFAETAADADALATAFYLMGVETTIDFCERHPAVGAILVVEADCDVPFEVQTAGRLPEEIVWET